MSRKKKFERKKSKYEDQTAFVNSVVCKIDYQNEPVGKDGRLKTVFYCPSYLCPEGRMCIVYGITHFKVGDEVAMKGRFNDGVFLVWSMHIVAKAEQLEERKKLNEERNARNQERLAELRERLKNFGTNPETNSEPVSQ